MSFGFLANPPVTLLPVFSEASFDYSTSSTSTINPVLLQAQTDDVYTDASDQSVVLAGIGVILNTNTIILQPGIVGTTQTYNSTTTLAVGSYYAISFAFNFSQSPSLYTMNALTLQDNFGNIYDAGRGAIGASVRDLSIASNKLYVGDNNPFTLTIYSDATINGGAYTYNIQINILKIK